MSLHIAGFCYNERHVLLLANRVLMFRLQLTVVATSRWEPKNFDLDS